MTTQTQEPENEDCDSPDTGVKIFFNPWAFTIEQNNEFIRRGYEPIPIQIPKGD